MKPQFYTIDSALKRGVPKIFPIFTLASQTYLR